MTPKCEHVISEARRCCEICGKRLIEIVVDNDLIKGNPRRRWTINEEAYIKAVEADKIRTEIELSDGGKQ